MNPCNTKTCLKPHILPKKSYSHHIIPKTKGLEKSLCMVRISGKLEAFYWLIVDFRVPFISAVLICKAVSMSRSSDLAYYFNECKYKIRCSAKHRMLFDTPTFDFQSTVLLLTSTIVFLYCSSLVFGIPSLNMLDLLQSSVYLACA